MKRAIFALMLTLAPLLAQTEKRDEPRPPQVQKLFILKYADPRYVAPLLQVFNASVMQSQDLHAITVTASEQIMRAVEDAINKLDVPAASPKNVELTMQLVIGSGSDSNGEALPKDLEGVASQLHNTFPFKSYRLLDVMTLRARVGQRASTDSSGGAMQFNGITKSVFSTFNINSSSLGPDGTTVKLDGLRAVSTIPVETGQGQFMNRELNLSTDVDIKEGQKVVIGRHGITRDQALFLVLSAKVVQ
jgi:hypothetical protein